MMNVVIVEIAQEYKGQDQSFDYSPVGASVQSTVGCLLIIKTLKLELVVIVLN